MNHPDMFVMLRKSELEELLENAFQRALSHNDLTSTAYDVLNAKECAEYLRISPRKIYRLVKEDSIPCSRLGKNILFQKSELLDWLKALEND